MPEEDEKPLVTTPVKSSMEILSELFSTFDAEPPLIIKKEKDETKKHKKSKKKHKHKDKKHKKKDKKRKRSDSSSSQRSAVDLAELLIKQERQSPEKKIKLEENVPDPPNTNNDNDSGKSDKSKITIKNIKFSSIFEATIRTVQEKTKGEAEEEGEVSLSDNEQPDTDGKHKKEKLKKKRKHKHDDKVKKKKKHSHRSTSREKIVKLEVRDESPDNYKSRKSDYKTKDTYKNEKFRDNYKDRDKYRDLDEAKSSRSYDDGKHKRRERYKDDTKCDDKWFMKDRYRGYTEADRQRERRFRDRSDSRNGDNRIDKKKLLEIARRNAIQMMKSGNLPGALTLGRQAQEKVLAAIRSGGKTIEELTDFCKTLSKQEELGELSAASGEDEDADNAFHHPFQIKDRPAGIVMNIKNSIPLPTKTAQERTTELRMQFPVSSGTLHRKTENEWIPVSPKKIEAPPPPVVPVIKAPPPPITSDPPLAIEAPPPPSLSPTSQMFADATDPSIDIGAIVSQRLTAMRKLQENPYDVEALQKMHKSQKEMQTWAESKQQPGQFTGTTGAHILTQAELSSGYQAWARKDQLQNAAPVCGGMGMHLLKKMGWNPGEGLGKEKTGALEPLLLEVKLDKKGLVANEEQKRKQQKIIKSTVKTLEGKHPVSLLGEFTAKRKLGAPQYELCLESGPDHKKVFLFKVIVNGMEYQPDAASPNKKQAKADAAKLCLQQMGLLAIVGKL